MLMVRTPKQRDASMLQKIEKDEALVHNKRKDKRKRARQRNPPRSPPAAPHACSYPSASRPASRPSGPRRLAGSMLGTFDTSKLAAHCTGEGSVHIARARHTDARLQRRQRRLEQAHQPQVVGRSPWKRRRQWDCAQQQRRPSERKQ